MQYARTFSNLAPRGCTQFHFGTIMGMVNTFNFASGVHLANQNQNICVRFIKALILTTSICFF